VLVLPAPASGEVVDVSEGVVVEVVDVVVELAGEFVVVVLAPEEDAGPDGDVVVVVGGFLTGVVVVVVVVDVDVVVADAIGATAAAVTVTVMVAVAGAKKVASWGVNCAVMVVVPVATKVN
jgi:hypothetical protein